LTRLARHFDDRRCVEDSLSTKAMILPVRPPTLDNVLPKPFAAPASAGPAALVTRDRPCWALDWYSFAFPAVSFAASVAFCVVVLSNRRPARRRAGERRTGRARDMVREISVGAGGFNRLRWLAGRDRRDATRGEESTSRAPDERSRSFAWRSIDGGGRLLKGIGDGDVGKESWSVRGRVREKKKLG
jgi:hypothetical protein